MTAPPPDPPSGAAARQLTFDLPVRTALGLEDFMVTPANAAAVAAVENWPHWANPVLAIVGPPASGKTHLGKVWQYLSGAFEVAARGLDLAAAGRLVGEQAMLIEDAPSPSMDEQALFHAINLAREHERTILITSCSDPAHWNVTLPDLASRLRAAGVARLDAPDDDLLRAVLVKQFADRQIRIDEAAVSYMLKRMERSFSAARELVERVDRRALAEKARVTRGLVARVMSAKS